MREVSSAFSPGFGAPVHRVDLGEVAAQRPTRAHLDAPDRVRRPGRLGQRGVTRSLATLLLACPHYGEGRGKEGKKDFLVFSFQRVII